MIEPVVGTEKNTIYRIVSCDKQQSFYICLDEEVFQDELNKLRLANDLFICRDQALDDTKGGKTWLSNVA